MIVTKYKKTRSFGAFMLYFEKENYSSGINFQSA